MQHDSTTEGEQPLPLGIDPVPTPATHVRTPPSTGSTRRKAKSTSSRTTLPATADEGIILEMRLARVAFWEGSYSRRGIDLQRHFNGERLTVTDLDLLAFAFTPQLRRLKTIGEAKTGTSKTAPRPLDRVIWLAGLMPVVGADTAELVTALDPAPRVRELAGSLRVRAMNVQDLVRREYAADIGAVADVGAHGPTALQRMLTTHSAVKGTDRLERAFWFLRCEAWFLAPWSAVKRTLGLLRHLNGWWDAPPRGCEESTLRWLYAEALSVLTLNLVTVLEPASYLELEQWRAVVQTRLAEGAVPMHQMRALSASIDEFIARVMAELRAPAAMQVEAVGAFLPRPPEYADPLAELTFRFVQMPPVASLPRHMDLVIHERLVHRRDPDLAVVTRVSLGLDDLGQARRLLAAFLRGHVGLPEPVDRALVASTQGASGEVAVGRDWTPPASA